MINNCDILRLNRYAQGILTLDDARRWFESSTQDNRRDAITWLLVAIREASYRPEDILAAADRQHLRPTFTPEVLMTRDRGHKLRGLPEKELGKAFVLLLGILSVADDRRRSTSCRGSCSHWWHQDLTGDDDLILARINPAPSMM